ncbi:MAG: hypothetical protein ACOCWQ_01845 [Nanoarchaeota archaeon]
MGLKGKRAMFFTFTALVFISLLLFVKIPRTSRYTYQEQQAVINRIQAIDSFIENIKKDADIAMHTAGFRSLIGMIQKIQETGLYIPSVQSRGNEMMKEGTYGGDPIFVMANNTLHNWIEKMGLQAERLGVDLNITIGDIAFFHTDPWEVSLATNMTFYLNDTRNLAEWNFTAEIESAIPIEGYLDPVYIIGTGNLIIRTINISPYAGNFSNASVLNLRSHMQQGLYLSYSEAPNYLMRLEGDLTAAGDDTGIESLVYKDDLAAHLPIDEHKTNIDHIYFSSDDPVAYHVGGMATSFALDNQTNGNVSRHELYNVTGRII